MPAGLPSGFWSAGSALTDPLRSMACTWRAAHQVVWVHVAVHPHVRPARRKVPDHATRTRSEVLERVLRVDAAFDGVPLSWKSMSETFNAAHLIMNPSQGPFSAGVWV